MERTDSGVNKSPGETLSKAKLKERGWTEAGIKRFLGEPDGTKPNPKYKNGAPMSLYQVARVEAAEQTPEYLAWKAKKRRDGAARAVRTKKALLHATIERWRPEVPVLDIAKLRRKAIANYNSHREERAVVRERDLEWTPATERSDEAFLARITVNYVRHVLTPYDGLLGTLHGKVGIEEAKELVRAKVYDAIAATYPHLASECSAQEHARAMFEMMRENLR
jgi:hypothetical protein